MKRKVPSLRKLVMGQFTSMCGIAAATALLIALAPLSSWAAEPIELDHGDAPHHPQQPQVAIDTSGSIHVVYGIGEVIRYRRSDDGGKTFGTSLDLPAVQNMSLGMRRGPRIGVSGKALCVTAIGGKQGKGRDGDLWALRSDDGAKSWMGPVRVNDVANAAREGLHAMCAGPQGELCCVWLDLRNGKTEVMFSRSLDGGASWTKNTRVYKSPDGSVCECCHPYVVMDGRSVIHVQWRNSLAGNRDIYVASSNDGGKTFGAAAKLGAGSWSIGACPMDGGAIAVGAEGKILSVWRRDQIVFLSREGESSERRLGMGEQPWIAANDAGAFIVWLKKRGDMAYLLTPESQSPVELANQCADPVIAASPLGQGPVVAAWEQRRGGTYGILCQVVSP